MGSIDYKKLYSLQDEVLEKVFAVEDEFYLTGGTALSRFYKEKRYSDDLDFFTNSSTRFNFAIKNILSNKITAVIGRDNPKDIFDIYLINKYYSIDWSEILESAQEKSVFSIDDLIVRLKSFPHRLLGSINMIEENFLDSFQEDFSNLMEEIENS